MNSTPEITICTVSYYHYNHLKLNIDLVSRMNPDLNLHWVIGENTPHDGSDRLNSDEAAKIEVLETEKLVPEGKRPRHQHITALHACIAQVKTRYMLVLDPDFYVIHPNWLSEAYAHMQAEGLALFGAPWHPRRPRKYRYFPCVHCTLVDREAFEGKPYSAGIIDDEGQQSWLKAAFRAPGVATPAVQRWWRLNVVRRVMSKRWVWAWSVYDTGSELFGRYWSGEKIAFDLVTPVFRVEDFRTPNLLSRSWDRWIERLAPDYLSYLPKRLDSYSTTSAFLAETPDTAEWETFVWKAQPFALHMRGNTRRDDRDAKSEVEAARVILAELTRSSPVAN